MSTRRPCQKAILRPHIEGKHQRVMRWIASTSSGTLPFKDQKSSMLQETDVEAATEPVPLDKLVATVDNEAEELQEGVSLWLEVTERRIQYAKKCDEMKKTAAVKFETACQPFVVQLPPLFAAACQDDEPARNQSTVAATEKNLSKAEAGNQSAHCPQS